MELTPSFSDGGEDLSGLAGTTVTVRSDAAVGENVWALSLSGGSSLSSFEEKGLKSEGGSLALVALTSLAVELFTRDGLELSLTLTARNESGGEERGTATVFFVSSARGFKGDVLTASFEAAVLSAGVGVFGASSVSLTIWHSANESESYALEGASAGLFTVGADGGVSVRDNIQPTEAMRYELTLAVVGGRVGRAEAVSRRELVVELTPPLLDADEELSELRGLTVTVEARATVGDFVWGVMPPAGGMFAPFADVNGFASAGGSAAALSLSSDATVLFDRDGLALSLTLTLTGTGEEATGTVTFVSSAREFNGSGLRTLIVTTALSAGTEVFGSSEAGLTIWHSPNENESYALEGADAGLFAVGLDGAVSVRGEIRPTELARYELTLALSDGGGDGAAGVDGGVDAAVAERGRGFVAVEWIDGDGGSEGDGG